MRYGPRTLDLDILLYGDCNVDIRGDDGTGRLIVPHERLREREFVLRPLCDIDEGIVVPGICGDGGSTVGLLLRRLLGEVGGGGLVRVMGLRGERERLLYWGKGKGKCMGIVNRSVESFSGDCERGLESVKERVGLFVENGFEIVDVGGQSTAPGAEDVGVDEEIRRVVPVVEVVRKEWPEICISVDTFRAEVARNCLMTGADVVNDVSAGSGDGVDGKMQEVVRCMDAGWVMMHRRGDSKSMDQMAEYGEKGVVAGVVEELGSCIRKAMVNEDGKRKIVPRWMIWGDPGVGFAKTQMQSLKMMAELRAFKRGIGGYPVLVGPSRKRFVGGAAGRKEAKDRDWATAGAAAVGVMGGADIIRAHNPRIADAVRFANAVLKSNATEEGEYLTKGEG